MEIRRRLMMRTSGELPEAINGASMSWTLNIGFKGTMATTDGTFTSTNYYKGVDEFIPCGQFKGHTVRLLGGPTVNTVSGACFYSSADEASFIAASAINQDDYVVPRNAEYVRFATNKNKDVALFSLQAIK